MVSCTRLIQFCAGHRVYNHESKCAHPHGHNYVAEITAESPSGLDKLGRVIDFSVIKEQLGTWIDKNWDHGFIYFALDSEMAATFQRSGWKSYAMYSNPTAENMADHLLRDIAPTLFTEVKITRIKLWETQNCFAEVTL